MIALINTRAYNLKNVEKIVKKKSNWSFHSDWVPCGDNGSKGRYKHNRHLLVSFCREAPPADWVPLPRLCCVAAPPRPLSRRGLNSDWPWAVPLWSPKTWLARPGAVEGRSAMLQEKRPTVSCPHLESQRNSLSLQPQNHKFTHLSRIYVFSYRENLWLTEMPKF